jgi:hypothetical protein
MVHQNKIDRSSHAAVRGIIVRRPHLAGVTNSNPEAPAVKREAEEEWGR